MATTDRVLLSPIRLGPVEVRNRVVSTSHQTSLVEDHVPTDALFAYHEARARGGAGLISLEATAVDESGLLTPHIIGGYLSQIVPVYKRMAGNLHEHGSRFFVQLLHGGREQISSAPRAPAIGPSAIPSQRFRSEPRAMTKLEIEEIVAGFAISARHCREGGVDGIEVSMAHGYLLSQFFSPMSNRRDDEYNGDLDNRLRFAREVLGVVREAAGPDLAVGVRLAADEWTPGSLREDACREIAVALCADGAVDFVSLALGHSATYSGSNLIAPPPPIESNAIADRARRIRAALPGIPVVVTTRVLDADAAEDLIAGGAADLVGMTRAMIADPDLVSKTASGRSDEVIPCIGCNQGCIGHYHTGLPIACLVNPRTGRERYLYGTDGWIDGGVLVIGAGPAGVAAALAASEYGQYVVLAEREEEIGGQFRLAGQAPGHREMWSRYETFFRARLEAVGVELRLGTEIAPGDLEEFGEVVVATGANPYLSPESAGLPGNVVQAWDAIRDPASVEGPALIVWWGGGWSGLDTAETLAEAGLEVTLACSAVTIGEDVHQYQRNLYLDRLDRLGVRLEHHTELAVVDGQCLLRNPFSNRTRPLPTGIGTIVLDQGRVPDDDLWVALSGREHCTRVGDVLGPRSAEEAIREGADWFELLTS